jgi:hypothetical protein
MSLKGLFLARMFGRLRTTEPVLTSLITDQADTHAFIQLDSKLRILSGPRGGSLNNIHAATEEWRIKRGDIFVENRFIKSQELAFKDTTCI